MNIKTNVVFGIIAIAAAVILFAAAASLIFVLWSSVEASGLTI